MNTKNLFSAVLLCVAPLIAQQEEPRNPRPVDPKPPLTHKAEVRAAEHVALSEVLGAKVRLKAKAEDRAEAAAEGKTAKGPNGSINDLILDSGTGQATWAIVSVGGLLGIGDKEVAVPMSALMSHRVDEKPLFELEATEAELKSLAAFDKKAMEKNIATSTQAAEASWRVIRPDAKFRRAVEATTPRHDDGDGNGKTIVGKSVDAILGSQVKSCKLRSKDAEGDKTFGEVENASYDVTNNAISYLIIGRGGVLGIGEKSYLVPFSATRVVVIDDKPVLQMQKTTSELESATKYVKPDRGVISEENAKASCDFFGVKGKHKGD
jgi:hypothetical protein